MKILVIQKVTVLDGICQKNSLKVKKTSKY